MADRGHRQEDGWNSEAHWTEKVKFHNILSKRKRRQAEQDLEAAKRLIQRSKDAFAESIQHDVIAGQIEKANAEPVLKR